MDAVGFDTLGLENSVSRARTLAYLAMAAIKLLDVGELEQRLTALEAASLGQKSLPESVFEAEFTDIPVPSEDEA